MCEFFFDRSYISPSGLLCFTVSLLLPVLRFNSFSFPLTSTYALFTAIAKTYILEKTYFVYLGLSFLYFNSIQLYPEVNVFLSN